MEFFVYFLLDVRKKINLEINDIKINYEPFYVGKGKKDRPYKHFKENLNNTINEHKFNVIQKILKETGLYPEILIIKDNMLEDEAFEYEKEMIKLFGVKPDGLLTNKTDGGFGGNTYKYKTTEEIQLIREKLSGNKNPMYGVNRSDEWRKKHSDFMKGKFSGERNPMYGINRSDEWRKKHSDFMKGKFSGEKNPMYSKKHTDEVKKLISEMNKDKTPWNKGKTGIYSEETLKKMRCKKNNKKTIVLQYTLDMSFIKEWKSITEAANEIGIRKTGIINCCKGRYSNSGGFIWRYKEENNGDE